MQSRRLRQSAFVAWGVLALSGLATVARAHDVTGSRFDAPLPLDLLLVGAGATVALTALWLAVTDEPSESARSWPLTSVQARTVRWVGAASAAVFGLAVVGVLVSGVAGRQVPAENFATVFTWPVWFRGLALLALLVGTPWRVLSPWRRLYRGLCRLEGETITLRGYPSWLGHWPALLGFLVLIGVVENLTVIPRSPALTTVVVAAYALVMVGGAVVFGPTWFERADPLGVLYRLLGRVSMLSLDGPSEGDTKGRTLGLRVPWVACTRPLTGNALVIFVVAAVYTVSFDGFSDTRQYQTVLFGARDLLATGPPTSVLLYGLGLAGFVGLFVLVVRVGDAVGRSLAPAASTVPDGGGSASAPRAFAPTVLPIAAAYEVAHNYPYVLRSAGRLFGTDALSVLALPAVDPLAWLSLPAFWGSQALLIVLGHVVAVVAAHRVAIARYPSSWAARGGHLPLVVLMVGYTVLSLWILSQPVVGG